MKRTEALRAAFARDGYEVARVVQHENGARGLLAESTTATNAGTADKKRAYYLEGDPHTLGWLMGNLAEPQIANMAENYVVNVIPAMINERITDGGRLRFLVKWFVDLIETFDKEMAPDIPQPLIDEIQGLVDGCRAANPETKVSFKALFTLNFGFDFLLSYYYAPNDVLEGVGIDPSELQMLLACNAFSAWGEATKDGVHYFGRDFMFPSADVFQFCAAMSVVVPSEGHPFVTMGAPGFVGSITAMNAAGIAAGVQMVPGGNVNHQRPGFNSLGLVRWAIQHCDSAESVVAEMRKAQRGVSWLYPVSDAPNGRAVTIEAGRSGDLDPLSFPPEGLRSLLPTAAQLAEDPAVLEDGMVARWNDYDVPRSFRAFNAPLFAKKKKTWFDGLFGAHGSPGANIDGPELPQSYFFSPELTDKHPDIHVTCNTFLSPKMRLCSMDPWTVLVGDGQWNDLQWRYQALTFLLRKHRGEIDRDRARQIIDYLAPDGIYPDYYKWLWGDPEDWRDERIDGCVSLFDVTHGWVTSHWGNYGDDWVSLTLGAYLED